MEVNTAETVALQMTESSTEEMHIVCMLYSTEPGGCWLLVLASLFLLLLLITAMLHKIWTFLFKLLCYMLALIVYKYSADQ